MVVDGKSGEASSKDKSLDERTKEMSSRAGGLPTCLDQEAMREFMASADQFMKDTIGEEGDKDMWSECSFPHPSSFR